MDLTSIIPIVTNVVQGATVGLGLAILGFVKRENPQDENFDKEKFVQTIAVGTVIGGAAACYNLPIADMTVVLTEAGVVTVVDWVVKIVYRRLVSRLRFVA